jgi:hypothetical protein
MKRKNRDVLVRDILDNLSAQADPQKRQNLTKIGHDLMVEYRRMKLKNTKKSIRSYSPIVGL